MRLTRWAAASLFLVALAAPYWRQSVDDVYIPLAFAREWLDSGELRWTSGERVEGYSNFAWVVLLGAALRLGLDGAVAAKAMGLLSGVAVLGLVSRFVPTTPQGTALVFALSVWAPLARWSTDGMETVFYALLLAAGWVSTVAGAWRVGMWVLAAASLTRPEGLLYVGLAAAVGWVRGHRRVDAGWAALGALVLYHAARMAWFGALLPTPILVKIAPVPWTHYGWLQAAGELLTACGVLLGMGLAIRPRKETVVLAAVPLLWQLTVLGRASGDWMTGARLILPGVVATAVTLAAVGRPREGSWLGASAVVLLGAVCGVLLPVGYGSAEWVVRDRPALPNPFSAYARGIDTPLAEDVSWVVEEVPEGDTVFVTDVGMLGNIPGVRVMDMRGLVQRRVAEAIAAGAEESGFRAYLAGEAPPSFFRVAAWGGARPEEPPAWMLERHRLREEYGYSGGTVRWYAAHARRPSAETIVARWEALNARYPSQPHLAWHHALALADAGRWAEAREVAAAAAHRWPDRAAFTDATRSLSFPRGPRPAEWVPGRGRPLYWNTSVTSRPVAKGPMLHLDADNPGADGAEARVEVVAGCGSAVTTERVFGPTQVPVSPPACASGSQEFRVRVTFANDTSVGGDRNLYAWLDAD